MIILVQRHLHVNMVIYVQDQALIIILVLLLPETWVVLAIRVVILERLEIMPDPLLKKSSTQDPNHKNTPSI